VEIRICKLTAFPEGAEKRIAEGRYKDIRMEGCMTAPCKNAMGNKPGISENGRWNQRPF